MRYEGRVLIISRRQVTYEQGKKYSDDNEFLGFIETSAKNGSNVSELFIYLCEKLFQEKKMHVNI